MPLKCNVQVTLNNISKKKAAAIKNALEPDNVISQKVYHLKSRILITNLFLIFKVWGTQRSW